MLPYPCTALETCRSAGRKDDKSAASCAARCFQNLVDQLSSDSSDFAASTYFAFAFHFALIDEVTACR
jgi:hypothetical protein